MKDKIYFNQRVPSKNGDRRFEIYFTQRKKTILIVQLSKLVIDQNNMEHFGILSEFFPHVIGHRFGNIFKPITDYIED